MTTEQRRRVRALFEQALDRNSSEIHDWLAQEAGDDSEVAAEVESLLRHHNSAGSFLVEPVAGRVSHLFDDDPRFEPGAVLGPYTIVRELGRGGMGRVYLATDARLRRTVALKALPPSLTRDGPQRERLRREARAAASLTHPGICTIYALEELDDDVFIAAEFVDGHSLREEIAQGDRPSPSALIEAARELADALASAHAKGITHRDLKPENVMRGRDGRLKILDFGLALSAPSPEGLGALPRVTQPGAIVGTPAYMAPEQLKGETIDARTDVFAFGVLLYEYACGLPPFDAQTPLALAARVLGSEPRPIGAVRPDTPAQIAVVIERCLQKLPADRFASAADILPELTPVKPVVPSASVTGWWRLHQIVILGLYFLASALAWQIKEWQHGLADRGFLFIAIAATVAGVFRGHVLFTERMNRTSFAAERRRAEPVTLSVDVLIGLTLAAEGWQLYSARPVAGALTIALSLGLALARVKVEPSTSRGAFGGT